MPQRRGDLAEFDDFVLQSLYLPEQLYLVGGLTVRAVADARSELSPVAESATI